MGVEVSQIFRTQQLHINSDVSTAEMIQGNRIIYGKGGWHGPGQKFTVGADFSSLGASKKGSSLKPNIPATSTVGKI